MRVLRRSLEFGQTGSVTQRNGSVLLPRGEHKNTRSFIFVHYFHSKQFLSIKSAVCGCFELEVISQSVEITFQGELRVRLI